MTGGGLTNEDTEEPAVDEQLYVGPDGPKVGMPPEALNLWGMFGVSRTQGFKCLSRKHMNRGYRSEVPVLSETPQVSLRAT